MMAIIVGGDSKLGGALERELVGRGQYVFLTTRRKDVVHSRPVTRQSSWGYLDLLEPRFPEEAADATENVVVYIVAAVTGVVQCERDPMTWRVNADAPSQLAAVARCWGWQVVFVSSDAVECAPHTAYAKQKAHAESVVLALGGHVVRPARIAPEKYADVARVLAELGEKLVEKLSEPGTIIRWEG